MLTSLCWALLLLHVWIVLQWSWGHVQITRCMKASRLPPITFPARTAPLPRLSVIIAAHNEEATIGICLQRVLAQDYPELQILVANDRSTDATGQIIRDMAREHDNIRCVDIERLPPGWLGKTHALAEVAPQANGEYLVFIDSDVEWHPAMLRTAVEFVERQRADFVSLWPRVVVKGFWERLLLPACAWMLNLWFSNADPAHPEKTRVFANGQFVMVRRDAYTRIGGHAAVPDEMAEDVALARRARDAGLRCCLAAGVDLFQTRMYENLAQITSGWTRIFIGALGARWKLAASIVAILLGVLMPFVVLGVLAARAAAGMPMSSMGTIWLCVAAAHLLIMYPALYRMLTPGFSGRYHLALIPFAMLWMAGLLVRCLWLVGGRGTIEWGGVRYQVHGSRAVRSALI